MKRRKNQQPKKEGTIVREQTQKVKCKKKQDREEGKRRPECIPLGSYFKALSDIFEENSYKAHFFTEIGNHSDWAEAHTCKYFTRSQAQKATIDL